MLQVRVAKGTCANRDANSATGRWYTKIHLVKFSTHRCNNALPRASHYLYSAKVLFGIIARDGSGGPSLSSESCISIAPAQAE